MEEENKFPSQEEVSDQSLPKPEEKPEKKSRKLLFILIFLGLSIGLSAAFFFLGKKRAAKEEISTNSEELLPTESPTPTTEEIPSETPTPTPIKTPTPTPKPTQTPSTTPTPTPVSETTSISSSSGLDGFRANNNGGNNSIEIRAGNGSFVGSPAYELVTRGFVSFNLPSSLTGKTIEKATLRLYQRSIAGTPFASGNSVIVDHLDYGNELASDDFDRSPISANVATLTGNPVVEWKDADVTNAVKNDIQNARTRSQFRIRLSVETDADGVEDIAYFDSANPGYNTNTPQLVVKYH